MLGVVPFPRIHVALPCISQAVDASQLVELGEQGVENIVSRTFCEEEENHRQQQRGAEQEFNTGLRKAVGDGKGAGYLLGDP